MRRLVMGLGLLLAIAAANIGVAWLCAAFSPLDAGQSRILGWAGRDPSAGVMRGFGRTRIAWIGEFPPVPPADTSDTPWRTSTPARGRPFTIEDSGWPFRCMRATTSGGIFFVDGTDFSTMWGGNIGSSSLMFTRAVPLADEQLSGMLAGAGPIWRALPLQPLWLGLAANTVTYLGVFAAVVAICRASLRRFRTSRGRCPRCGYQLVSSGRCPECGAQ